MKRMILAGVATLVMAVGIVAVSAPVAQAQSGDCYELMVDFCNQQAANAAEGGFDAAYDQCVANWYANSGCSNQWKNSSGTPWATGNKARPPAKQPPPIQTPGRKR